MCSNSSVGPEGSNAVAGELENLARNGPPYSPRIELLLDAAVEAYVADDILGALLLLKQAQEEDRRERRR